MSNTNKRGQTSKTPDKVPPKDSDKAMKIESYSFSDMYENHTIRYIRVDPISCQTTVPPLLSKKSKAYNRYKKRRTIEEVSHQNFQLISKVFDPDAVDPKKFEEYLNFVKSLSPETGGPSVGMLMSYNNRMEEQAIHFLHKMNYSFTKAKFYLLFPTLMHWNEYSADSPLEISEKEMEEKINFYITQMQETKTSQHEKWRNELQELLNSRVLLSRLSAFIEQGKSLGFKNEIPDFLKEMLSKTAAFSKEIKQKLHQKTTMEKLEDLRRQSEEYKIISNEMLELNESIERSRKWLENMNKLGSGPYNLRELEILINDYKNVPLEHEDYHKYKKILDESRDFLDKLPNFAKLNKTRHHSTYEKIPIDTARQYAEKMAKLNVKCEEFEAFFKALEAAGSVIENVQMFLEDERTPKNLANVTAMSKELNTIPFTDKTHKTLQDYIDYFTIVERMHKNLYSKNKLDDVEEDLVYCKTRGFSSEEINDIAEKVRKIREIYIKTDEFLRTKKTFNIKFLFQSYASTTLNTPDEAYLLQLINNGEELLADKNLLGDLYSLRDLLNEWKERTKENLTFDDMIRLLNEGFALNFKTQELWTLFEKAKKILIWTIQAINLIKKYDFHFKPKLLNESYSGDLQILLEKTPIYFENDYKQMHFLTADKPENFQSYEYDKLIELKQKSEAWSQKSNEILASKNYNEEIIKGLLKESEAFPTEQNLRNELKEINNSLNWINRAQEVINKESENKELIQQLQKAGVQTLIDDLSEIRDFSKEDATKFLVNHRNLIQTILQILTSPECKLKSDNITIEYLEHLLQEVQTIRLPEENQYLVGDLTKLLERVNNWMNYYQKLKVVEKKKKGPKGKKGRGGRRSTVKREDQEKLKAEPSVITSEINKSERPDIEFEKSVGGDFPDLEDTFARRENRGFIHIEDDNKIMTEEEEQMRQQTDSKDQMVEEKIEEKIEEKAEAEARPNDMVDEQGEVSEIKQEKDDIKEENEEEKEVKEETGLGDEKKDNKNEKGKHVFTRDSDNFFYFFKLPLILCSFYEGLNCKIPIEELKLLRSNLVEINIFITSTNRALNRKLRLDDLDQMITQGVKLKLYLVETEQCQKLYKWGCSWLFLASQILRVVPYTKQFFKKRSYREVIDESIESRVAKNVDISLYNITYDEDTFEFILTRKEDAPPYIEEEIETKEETGGVKRYSRREKKMNRKFQDGSFTIYDPEVVRFEEKNLKPAQPPVEDRGRGKRRAQVMLSSGKKSNKKPATVKEVVKNDNLLKEENPNEHYCICRKGHDGLSYMIACDRCSEWFHGDCIGLAKSLYNKNIDFMCFACLARAHMEVPHDSKLTDYVWHHYNKVEYDDFMNLVQEARELPLDIPEINEIFELEGRIKDFMKRAEVEVAKGAQIDHLQNLLELSTMDKVLKEFEKVQLDRERIIKTLYLESIGLPVVLKIADELMAILHKRDLASEIIRLLNGKPNAKNIKKILSKDHSHIDMEKDPELKVLYDKLKNKYEVSSKIVERMTALLEQKTDPAEFGKLIKLSEENNMYIEKFDTYKKSWEDFNSWETRVRYAVQNKLDKDTMCQLQREYVNLAFKSNLIGVLNDIISEAEEWQKKALQLLNNPATSDQQEKTLITEGHNLRCKMPFIEYLEKRRQQQWVMPPFTSQSFGNSPFISPSKGPATQLNQTQPLTQSEKKTEQQQNSVEHKGEQEQVNAGKTEQPSHIEEHREERREGQEENRGDDAIRPEN